MHEYILNKVFITFMDDLETQKSDRTHPFVDYIYTLNKSTVGRISRRGKYITIDCPSKPDQVQIWKLVDTGEISRALSEMLVTRSLLKELRVQKIVLKAFLNDWELMTSRSQGKR